jgi:hypothetical protein
VKEKADSPAFDTKEVGQDRVLIFQNNQEIATVGYIWHNACFSYK